MKRRNVDRREQERERAENRGLEVAVSRQPPGGMELSSTREDEEKLGKCHGRVCGSLGSVGPHLAHSEERRQRRDADYGADCEERRPEAAPEELASRAAAEPVAAGRIAREVDSRRMLQGEIVGGEAGGDIRLQRMGDPCRRARMRTLGGRFGHLRILHDTRSRHIGRKPGAMRISRR